MPSQCQAINEQDYKTWGEYRKGCLLTFHGGYQTPNELEAFQHGMNTIFNLLEDEFPQPHEIIKNKKINGHKCPGIKGRIRQGIKGVLPGKLVGNWG